MIKRMNIKLTNIHDKNYQMDHDGVVRHTLKTNVKVGQYCPQVDFCIYPAHPDKVCIRSWNWKSEYEPRGWVDIKDARKLWAYLKNNGLIEKKNAA
jgi:hypothetical protein